MGVCVCLCVCVCVCVSLIQATHTHTKSVIESVVSHLVSVEVIYRDAKHLKVRIVKGDRLNVIIYNMRNI